MNYYFVKDPFKILNLRIDTLSQMMSLANLRPGARFIIVDGTGGLVVAAALDRLAGNIGLHFAHLDIILIPHPQVRDGSCT